MRISKEVIDQLIIGTQCVPPDYNKTAQAVIQTHLSEIWIRFDAEDESTWPASDFTSSGDYWLIKGPDNKCAVLKDRFYNRKWGYKGVTHYLDPADILPKEDK